MTVNIAVLPDQQRREIELSKHAALLINNLKQKKISRHDINQEIEALEDCDKQAFKNYLNKYREGGK